MNISQLLLNAWFGEQDSILVLGDFCEENNIYFQGLVNTDVEGTFFVNNYDCLLSYGNSNVAGNGGGYGYCLNNGDGISCGFDCGYGYDNGGGSGFGDGNELGDSYGYEEISIKI